MTLTHSNLNKRDLYMYFSRDFSGETPLHTVVRSCGTGYVTALLSKGANVNIKGKKGQTGIFLYTSFCNV